MIRTCLSEQIIEMIKFYLKFFFDFFFNIQENLKFIKDKLGYKFHEFFKIIPLLTFKIKITNLLNLSL